MKCLVFSDSHGKEYLIERALRKNPDAEVVFFLGDGLSGVDEIARANKDRIWIAVRGNCDFYSFLNDREIRKSEEIVLDGRKIFLTHGDIYSVKSGYEVITNAAISRGASIVLFGHTHQTYEAYSDLGDGIYLFNPGSVAAPSSSFGIMTLTENSVLFSHGKL